MSTLKQLKGKYNRLVIPCCGQLSIAMAALKAGWKPEQIYASDVSFFSTVLAYSIGKRPLDDLGIKVDGKPWKNHEGYAELLYWLRYYAALAQSRHYFQSIYVSEIEKRKDAHIAKIEEGLSKFDCLKGLHYRPYDLFAEVEEAISDPENVIWLNPPGYKRGYQRMFDTDGRIEWDEPSFREFIPNTHHDELREKSLSQPALFLWYRYNVLAPEDRDYAVFADQKGCSRWDYTLANRPGEIKNRIAARQTVNFRKHYEVLPDGYEITEKSIADLRRTDEETALYYRDLFIHRLGATMARWYYLLIVDGYVAGNLGLTATGQWKRDAFDAYSEEGYGITAPSKRHPKLNRLLMMLIKCEEFQRKMDTLQFRSLGIATTCLSKYPELKINRGIYKLAGREAMKDGTYKLRYQGDRTGQNYNEVVLDWIARYS